MLTRVDDFGLRVVDRARDFDLPRPAAFAFDALLDFEPARDFDLPVRFRDVERDFDLPLAALVTIVEVRALDLERRDFGGAISNILSSSKIFLDAMLLLMMKLKFRKDFLSTNHLECKIANE